MRGTTTTARSSMVLGAVWRRQRAATSRRAAALAAAVSISALAATACRITRSAPAPAEAAAAIAAESAPEPLTWRWAGVEYTGTARLTKTDVVAALGIELGAPIPDGDPAWPQDRCDGVPALAAARCSLLRYIDGRAFLIVAVPAAEPPPDRPAPDGPSTWPTQDLVDAHQALRAESSRRFEAGDSAALRESFEPGYLTYSGEEMARLAAALHDLAVPHRDPLVTLVIGAADSDVRAEAAQLLNYVGAPETVVPSVLPALADADTLVRNNASRYLLQVVERLDPTVRRAAAQALADQLRRPAMSDRNKALYGLLAIARAEADPSWMRPLLPAAKTLASDSILPNVGGVAAELLLEVGQFPPRPPSDAVPPLPAPADPIDTVRTYLDAFNAHDVPAMLALASPDIAVFYADDAGELTLASRGTEALRPQMQAYFERLPTVTSALRDPTSRAPLLWFTEEVSWAGGSKSQRSVAVYEVRDGKVLRAAYAPAD